LSNNVNQVVEYIVDSENLAPSYLSIVDFNNNSGQVIEKDNCGGSECFKSL